MQDAFYKHPMGRAKERGTCGRW